MIRHETPLPTWREHDGRVLTLAPHEERICSAEPAPRGWAWYNVTMVMVVAVGILIPVATRSMVTFAFLGAYLFSPQLIWEGFVAHHDLLNGDPRTGSTASRPADGVAVAS